MTYYHVELDRHAVLLAEGMPAESYLDTGNRGIFVNEPGQAIGSASGIHERARRTRREAGSCAPFVDDPV